MTTANDANSIQRELTIVGLLSYAFLATPFKSKSDDGTFRDVFKTSVIMEPTAPDVEAIKTASREVAQAAWGTDPTVWVEENGTTITIPEWQAVMKRLAAVDKLALHNGNLQKEDYYKGKLFVTANFNPKPERGLIRPTIVATLGNPPANVELQPGHAFFPYSGCKAAVKIAVYAQSPKRKPVKHGPRINCQLMGVQFLAHGTAFGGTAGRIARANEFGINPLDADAPIPGGAAPASVGAADGLM
jgi:hypothetical protein